MEKTVLWMVDAPIDAAVGESRKKQLRGGISRRAHGATSLQRRARKRQTLLLQGGDQATVGGKLLDARMVLRALAQLHRQRLR